MAKIEKSQVTRRGLLVAVAAVGCCGGVTGAVSATISPASVDQITDLSATAASNMFRFEPDLVVLSPGDQLSFLNSRGDHTVHSVPELWPEGVPKVGIAHKPEALVQFNQDGFYGFRCRRHGQYGMVMLVVVGQPDGLETLQSAVETMRAKKRERGGFADLLGRYQTMKSRG